MEMQRKPNDFQTSPFFKPSLCRKIGFATAATILAFSYQNFSLADAWKVSLVPVNEQVRSHHARELLGKKYDGSPAQMVEKASSLGWAISNEVYKSLPKKYKGLAVELSNSILRESEHRAIDPVAVMAIIKTESSFNPMARGRHGEIGLMQLKPATAQWIAHKYKLPWRGPKTLENAKMNVRIGIAYLDYLREQFYGHPNKYISAYNMGAGKVRQFYLQDRHPHEYATRVMKNYHETYRRLAAATSFNLVAGF